MLTIFLISYSTLKVVLYEDRIERSFYGWKRSIALSSIQRLVIVEPMTKPGTPRNAASLKFSVAHRTVKWAIPVDRASDIIHELQGLLAPGIVEFDRSKAERFDIEGRKARAAKSLNDEVLFSPANRAKVIVLWLYLPFFLVPVSLAAYSVRNVPGYEKLCWTCIWTSAAIISYFAFSTAGFLTTRVSISSSGVKRKNLFGIRQVQWIDVKSVILFGTLVSIRSSNGTIRFNDLDRQWFLNDLIAAYANQHGIPIEDRSKHKTSM